jgi:hypothetical protein
VCDKYIQALGGADKLAKLTSYSAKGTYSGFDTDFSTCADRALRQGAEPGNGRRPPHDRHEHAGVRRRSAWVAGRSSRSRCCTLTSGNLDRARLGALANFPLGLRQAYPQWRAGRTILNDKDVIVLQATVNGDRVAQLFFDPTSGLLVRLLRFTITPIAFVPTQIDYADYRELPGLGVKIPFEPDPDADLHADDAEVQRCSANVPIDAAQFAKPAPAKAAVGEVTRLT